MSMETKQIMSIAAAIVLLSGMGGSAIWYDDRVDMKVAGGLEQIIKREDQRYEQALRNELTQILYLIRHDLDNEFDRIRKDQIETELKQIWEAKDKEKA